MNLIKSEKDLILIREATRIWKIARATARKHAKIGISLLELDLIINNVIIKNGGIACFHNYQGFPGFVCMSVNEVIIHGTASEYCLRDGDSLTLDIGVEYDHHFCDAAFTILIGNVSQQAKWISEVCENSLLNVISHIKPGITNYEIAAIIQDYIEERNFEIIRNYTGHGCGNEIHEDPVISNYRSRDFKKVTLLANMVICIEPMILIKSNKVYVSQKDNWSVIAKNKKLTSHWEHMLLITETGCEILTNEEN